jgi:hypothetical protein
MKAKNFTLLIFVIMLISVSRSYSQNLLTDGDFSKTEVIVPLNDTLLNIWSFWQGGGAEANATVVDGVCNYYISSPGSITWEIQLVQLGFPLVQGHTYRLSFDVKADADRTFGVFLGENGGSWADLLGYDRYIQNATTEWQKITLDFNAPCVFAIHKLSFELGTINISMYFDNVMLTDLGPYQPSVGIIGSSLGSWDFDIDMLTADNINYTILNLPMIAGAVKFRQDNMWCINWGGTTFPTGTGSLYGPDIAVSNPGNYDVTFNRETGEYSFTCVSNCSALIGIIGDAVPPGYGSEPDINMSTNDGITYTLINYDLTDGGAKFRKDDAWDVSWGGGTFPEGIAALGGPDIPVAAGTYKVTFNVVTGDYKFELPSIGILGSALPGGWNEDIDMQTTDHITYTLEDYPFAAGEVKFRQDNDWLINWGDYAFPSGVGYQYGPNIPVPEGTYTVTFNRLTGEYSFTATSCLIPAVQCPQSIYTVNEPGLCGANVFYSDVVAAPNCGGAGVTITQTAGLASGSFFSTGVTTNTFVITNNSGVSAACSFDVYVYDAEPPAIENLTLSPETIWPPDHKMVPVTIDYSTSDNCTGAINSEIWIWSNESDDYSGDGKTVSDYEVLDEHHVLLRAERSGTGTGREYYIYLFAWDEAYNFNPQLLTVTVPHDMKSGTLKLTVKSAGIQGDDAAMPVTMKIWPNPGDKYFNLDVESSSDENIELYIHDITGRLVSIINVTDKGSFRFGDDLRSGTYLATVRQGTFFKTIRIVKK